MKAFFEDIYIQLDVGDTRGMRPDTFLEQMDDAIESVWLALEREMYKTGDHLDPYEVKGLSAWLP